MGWCGVLAQAVYTWPTVYVGWSAMASLHSATVALECICVFEVVQIAMGSARGNLALGAVLHYTRLLEIVTIMPAVPSTLAVPGPSTAKPRLSLELHSTRTGIAIQPCLGAQSI